MNHHRRSYTRDWQRLVPLVLCTLFMAACAAPLDVWKSEMVSEGQRFCNESEGDWWYYDPARVYYQIADFTGDKKWERCAERAVAFYRDGYLLQNKFKVPAHNTFPHGLYMHYRRTGDAQSKEAVIMLAQHAAFANDYPAEWTKSSESSREVAYILQTKLLARKLGFSDAVQERLIQRLADQAIGHYEEWFIRRDAPFIRPFMAGLTAEALIMWYEETKDPRVVPVLAAGAEYMATHMMDSNGIFQYTDRKMPHGGTEPAEDLNWLVVPLYGFLYAETGDPKYKAWGDKALAGGTWNSFNSFKQFNQAYRWSFDYVRYTTSKPEKAPR